MLDQALFWIAVARDHALENYMDELGWVIRIAFIALILFVPIRHLLAKEVSDVVYNFWRTPAALLSAVVALVMILTAMFAGELSIQNPYDQRTISGDLFLNAPWFDNEGCEDGGYVNVNNQECPAEGAWLGANDRGMDMLSHILYGMQLSLIVGLSAVVLSMIIGIALGLIAGYVGGRTDAIIMRIADIQLSFPSILIALLINGIARGLLPDNMQDDVAIYVIILAIALSGWVRYARTVRGSTLVERNKEYVQAARVIGIRSRVILFRHILPNVMGPVLVIATIDLAIAIITEATLSFLGVGLPSTQPSLGTLLREGQSEFFSGSYWLVFFPGLALVLLALSVNLLGDWLRDALNPKLRQRG